MTYGVSIVRVVLGTFSVACPAVALLFTLGSREPNPEEEATGAAAIVTSFVLSSLTDAEPEASIAATSCPFSSYACKSLAKGPDVPV